MLTTKQVKARTKTVTRRLGWKTLKPGDILNGCKKCQGLKPGEKIERIAQIRVVSVRREALDEIRHIPSDCEKEGFPELTPWGFVAMFCREMKCRPYDTVTRIEFEYL
jgi:hypothetical protein